MGIGAFVFGCVIGGAFTAAIARSKRAETQMIVAEPRVIYVNPNQQKEDFFDIYRRIENTLLNLIGLTNYKTSGITILINGIQYGMDHHLIPPQKAEEYEYIYRHLRTIRHYRNQLAHSELSWEDIPNPDTTLIDFLEALEEDIYISPSNYRAIMKLGMEQSERIQVDGTGHNDRYTRSEFQSNRRPGAAAPGSAYGKVNGNDRADTRKRLGNVFNPNQTVLDLSNLGITEIPTQVFGMFRLRSLNLSGNPIDYLPDQICRIPELEYLNLSHTHMKSLPNNLLLLCNLKVLDLSYTMTTTLPVSLGLLPELRVLNISHTAITSIPHYLYSKPNLKIIR